MSMRERKPRSDNARFAMPSLPHSAFRLRTLKCLASHAKTQLLNPSRRISEVAYDVRFQSLAQFNRMFKRIFGQFAD
jgi:Helix-turn-helix domain